MSSQSGTLRLLALLSLLLCYCFGLNAQNILWVDSLSSGPRQQVEFLVNIANTDTIAAVQCDVVFPAGLSYVNNSIQLSARASGQTLSASMVSSNTLRILAYSLTGTALTGNNGPVASFTCQAGAEPGTFSLHVANVVLSNPENTNVLTHAYNGQCIILAPSIGTNADSVDFGSVALGQSSGFQLTITNSGNLPLSLQSISSSLSEIVALDSSSSSIGPGLSITRSLQFRPTVKGTKNGVMWLRCNDPKDSVKIIAVHGFAYAVNEIHVGSVSARSGHQAALRLSVNNMEEFSAFQCEILLPSVMKYMYGSAVLVGRSVDHSISADTISGNILQIIGFSPANTPFQGSGGDIAEMDFEVDGQGGTYALPITQAMIADVTGKNILSASDGGQLRIAAPLIQLTTPTLSLGSVSIFDTACASLQIGNTGDDTLKVISATMIDPSYALETTLPLCILPASSQLLNVRFHNGTRGTFSTPMTLIHNDVPHNPSRITTTASTFIPNTLKVVSLIGSPQDTVSVSLALDNAEPITALQFDLHLPAGTAFIPGSLVTTDRSSTHSLSSSVLSNGALRVLMFSSTLATFTGSTGEVARLKMVLAAAEGTTNISLDNVVISNTANQNVVSSTINGNVDTYTASAKGSCCPPVGIASESILAPTDIHLVADVATSAEVDASFFLRSPRSSSLPSGVQTASAYFWNFTNKGMAFTNGSLDVSLSSLSGVSNPSSLVWLKRENPDEPWTNLGGTVVAGRLKSVVPFSSFSEFAIGATSSDNPLPVEISSINVAQEKGTIVLNWTTSSELENYGFEIDRKLVAGQQVLGSSNSMNENSIWHQVGFVQGNGTSNVKHNYLLKDFVSPGEYCYRLKQIDRDGTIQYQNQVEVTVRLEEKDYGLKQNYPNPFNPATTFQFALKSTGNVDLSVYNSLGQKVCTLFNGITTGGILYSLPFDATDLASGTYFYVLRANGTNEVRKFLLLK
jgi:hypothetical protein